MSLNTEGGDRDLPAPVERLVRESGTTAARAGCEASKWLEDWLVEPNVALDGILPREHRRVPAGAGLVRAPLARIQTGRHS